MQFGSDFGPRVLHRQMYIDLVHAYLRDYGSQRDLARALGLTEAYVSFLLEPLRVTGTERHAAHWASVLKSADYEIAEAFKYLKIPSEGRARQIAAQLSTDKERCDLLLHHICQARKLPPAGSSSTPAVVSVDQAQSILRDIGDIHQTALFGSDAEINRAAYCEVWTRATGLKEAIEPFRSPLEYAQTLMYLHDVAQVFNRPDLALGFARQSILVLSSRHGLKGEDEAAVRLRINALLAEGVSLNTLGLKPGAMAVVRRAEQLPGYRHEPEYWLRSFLEQQLTALTFSKRIAIYQAEKIADQALGYAQADVIIQAGINRRLLDVHITYATNRSRRRAHELALQLRAFVLHNSRLTPLRRVQILRTLNRYFLWVNDERSAADTLLECLIVTRQANLVHQHQELLRAASSP